jgi:hypothetical protein
MKRTKQHEIITSGGVPRETYCGITIRSARQAHQLGQQRGLMCVGCHPATGWRKRPYRRERPSNPIWQAVYV